MPNKILRFLFFLFVFCLVFIPFEKEAKAAGPDSPTVLEYKILRNSQGIGQFEIKGLSPANTEVLIYINGSFKDKAIVGSEETETESFYFRSEEKLPPGDHEIYLIAKDRTSLLLSPPKILSFVVPELPAPTLLFPEEDIVFRNAKIAGLTVSGSSVLLYFNNKLAGQTEVLSHSSGTAAFYFDIPSDMASGSYNVKVIAQSKTAENSDFSISRFIKVEEAMPAPTIFYNQSQPKLITGLTKNDSIIKIFSKEKLLKELEVENHISGTANFSYILPNDLPDKTLVHATASDKKGKESVFSNNLLVRSPKRVYVEKNPLISEGASEEANETVAKIGNSPKDKLDIEIQSENDEKSEEKPLNNADIEKEISGLINTSEEEAQEETEEKETGVITETKDKLNKIKLDLLIFLAFVLGIIAWIFWVNKELAKEKNENDDDLKE